MEFIKVRVENQYNKYSEVAEGLVLREKSTTRMILVPTLSESDDGTSRISSSIIFERKGSKDVWERDKTFNLSKMSSGEWTKIDFKRDEMEKLIDFSTMLKDIYSKDGMPIFTNDYVVLRSNPFDYSKNVTFERIKKFIEDHKDDDVSTF